MLVRRPHRFGFTITELLVVIGTIIVLLGILLPALGTMRTQGDLALSMSNLRQIGTWSRQYSTDNREYILPSQFNYANDAYPGHVRDGQVVALGTAHMGTWADILWTLYMNASFKDISASVFAGGAGQDYSTDSPDYTFYKLLPSYQKNPMRSAAKLTRTRTNATDATPFGKGARQDEKGMPGYFAANNFFNTDASSPTFNGWYVTGQIRSPERSMYLVDSCAGETIEDEAAPYDVENHNDDIDFRYADSCIMLFMDGSTKPVGPWKNINDLQGDRGIRVQDLTKQ